MTYVVNKSDPTQPSITVTDGTVNVTDTSLLLIGRNYPNYGQAFASDLVHLLENFSSPTSPNNPITGQIWYDSSNRYLNFFDGLQWNPIGLLTTASIVSLPQETYVSPTALIPITDQGNAYSVTKSNFLSDVAVVQPGTIMAWPFPYPTINNNNQPPTGWLFCNGSSQSRFTYPNLYNVIGTMFGSSISNTFNVPNIAALSASNTTTSLSYIIKKLCSI